MKLALYSDLHLEFHDLKLRPGKVDAVVVAGDLLPIRRGNAIEWLDQAIPRRTPVIFVPGNHDYYGGVMDQAHDAWKQAAAATHGHVSVLLNDRLDLDGVTFLGTPLFSDLSLPSPLAPVVLKEWVRTGIADFQVMDETVSQPWTVDAMVRANQRARAFLDQELPEAHASGPAPIVVTHWAPSLNSCSPKYLGDALNPYFIVPVEDLVQRAQAWLHGHVHSRHRYRLGDRSDRGAVYCNPRGYIYRDGRQEIPGRYGPMIVEVAG